MTQAGSAPSNYWSIDEFYVYGVPTPPSVGTPISHSGWTATASVTESGGSPANAIDGTLNTRWSTGCAQANGQWFQIDMGSIHTFSTVEMNTGPNPNRHSNVRWGLLCLK